MILQYTQKFKLLCLLCLIIPALAFSKKRDSKTPFTAFLDSFQRFENRDTVLVLAPIQIPTEFGCGTAAHEFFSQLSGFRGTDCGKCASVTDQKSIDMLAQKMESHLIWYALHGYCYTIDHSGKQETLPFVNTEATKKLLRETIRLTVQHEKAGRKRQVYHATFINLQKEERTLKSYYLSKSGKDWRTDSTTTTVTPFKNNDPYLHD